MKLLEISHESQKGLSWKRTQRPASSNPSAKAGTPSTRPVFFTFFHHPLMSPQCTSPTGFAMLVPTGPLM